MKAIRTKYIGASNTRGARVSATDGDGARITLSWDHSLNTDGNHDRAAVALCQKQGWRGPLMRGGLPGKGNVYTFDDEYNRVTFELDTLECMLCGRSLPAARITDGVCRACRETERLG